MIFINGCIDLHFFFKGLRGVWGGGVWGVAGCDFKKQFSDMQSFGQFPVNIK